MRVIVSWIAALALFLTLASPALAQEDSPGPGKKRVLTIGTIVPGHMGWAKRAKLIIIPPLERLGRDRMETKIYWGGILGEEEDLLRQMKEGKLSGAAFSGSGTINACPEFAVVSLPFLFEGWDEVDFLRDRMQGDFDAYFGQRDMKLLGWLDQDFDQLYSVKNDPSTLEGLRRCRFIQWYGPVEQHLFAALGVKTYPTQISQAGQAFRDERYDAAIGPALFVLGLQLYPKISYVLNNHLRYSPVTIVLTAREWNQFSEEEHAFFEEEFGSVSRNFTELAREDSEKCLAAMVAYGVRRVTMDPAEAARLKEAARASWKTMSGVMFPPELLDRVSAQLAEFRSSGAP
ncbi:MAG: TRAP transporter substrate-binding protein DctP [Proteobacteria bacterium]|nr:TRAP transporter substrate-binding protein DctP [Pseudomonadota bacterium]